MKLRRVKLENVRSFLEPAEFHLDGDISIIIGPNGGGKTNLLDATLRILRRHFLLSWVPRHTPAAGMEERYTLEQNDAVNEPLERHSHAKDRNQLIEIELEATETDVKNIALLKEAAQRISPSGELKKYRGGGLRAAAHWPTDLIKPNERFLFRIMNDQLQQVAPRTQLFRDYLSQYELGARFRDELGLSPLSTPMLSLPVNRAGSAFVSSLTLANHSEYDHKRSVDAATSRSAGSIATLAVGRIAEKYRLLLEEDSGDAKAKFYAEPQIKALSEILKSIGYEWELESVNPRTNQYDIRLKKEGTSFLVGSASSGEKEILTYLFGVFALDVRDALVIVDEPEMHLHPRWQRTLLRVFEELVSKTGNQFVLATHSPVFISPASIQYVSRVYSEDQQSKIIRLNKTGLPEPKHLFSIVNSHNNESIFFSDRIVLVEGISDRLFFEAIFRKFSIACDIVRVGGKTFFEQYKMILDACRVPFAIIADLDYVLDIGSEKLKGIFAVDQKKVKEAIDDLASKDGRALVERLEEAIATSNLADLEKLWGYIKRRRTRLRTDLSHEELELLDRFIAEQKKNSVYILGRGSLEEYLPQGYKAKDVDKLIRLLGGDFWSQLAPEAQTEIEEIIKHLRA